MDDLATISSLNDPLEKSNSLSSSLRNLTLVISLTRFRLPLKALRFYSYLVDQIQIFVKGLFFNHFSSCLQNSMDTYRLLNSTKMDLLVIYMGIL